MIVIKLRHTMKIAASEKAQYDAETKRLKDDYNRSKARNAQVEHQLEKLKQATATSRDNARWAKEQTSKRKLAGRKVTSR